MNVDGALRELMIAVAEEAIAAGAEWLGQAGEEWSRIRFKASGEEVTDADVEVERQVTDVLRKRTPEIPVVGEESAGSGPLPSRCWVLDPIDGTVNFTRGAPLYAISLALVEDGEPTVGAICAPALGRRWSTGPGGGGRKAAASGVPELSRAVVGVSGSGSGRFPWSTAFLTVLHDRAYRVRVHGSMALDLVGVAEGWLDACLCAGPNPWDVAAGIALVRTRGGAALGADGDRFTWDSPVLAAGREEVARELLDLWGAAATAGR